MMYRPRTTTDRAVMPVLAFAVSLLPATVALSSSPVESAGSYTVQFQFNDEPLIASNHMGQDVGNGAFRLQGGLADPGGRWSVTWDYVLNPDPTGPASFLGHTSISNTSGGTAKFDFRIESPLCPMIAWHALYGGPVSVLLQMDADGGLMTHVPGSSVWSATADGSTAAGVFAPPFSLGGGGAGTAALNSSFGAPYPSHVGPGISDEAGMRLRFNMTSGETARITSNLQIGSPPGNLVECDFPSPLGDLNGDGRVDIQDMVILLGAWGRCDGCPADLNVDGLVDILDLLILLSNWG